MKGRFCVKPPPGAFLSYPNLSGFILFGEGGGDPRETFTNAIGTRSGTGTKAQWGRGEESGGSAMAFVHGASLASDVTFGTALVGWQDLAVTGAPGTIIARIYWDGTVTSGIAERNDGNTVSAGWELGITSTGVLGWIRVHSVQDLRQSTTTTVPSNRWTTIACGWDTSTVAAGTKMYFDGIVQPVTNQNNANGSSTSDAARALVVGNCSFTSVLTMAGSFSGSISWVAAFKGRQLSDAEVQNWSQGAQPWTGFGFRKVSRLVTPYDPSTTQWAATYPSVLIPASSVLSYGSE